METPAPEPRETAPSFQDPALLLKEMPEDKLGQGILDAKSEVSGSFLPLNMFFMKKFGIFLPPEIFSRSRTSHPTVEPSLQSSGSSWRGKRVWGTLGCALEMNIPSSLIQPRRGFIVQHCAGSSEWFS